MRAFTNKTHVRSRCSTLIQHSPACYNRMFTLPHSCSIPCSTFLIYSQIPAGESLSLRQRIRTGHHYRHGGIMGYFCLFPYQGVAKHFIVCKRCKRLELGTERDQQTDKLLTKVKHRGGDCGAICEMPHANINITRGHTHTHTLKHSWTLICMPAQNIAKDMTTPLGSAHTRRAKTLTHTHKSALHTGELNKWFPIVNAALVNYPDYFIMNFNLSSTAVCFHLHPQSQ